MAKIIKFPDQSDKVEDVKKSSHVNSYQNYVIVGLGVVFFFAVALNISFQNQSSQIRKLANYETQISEAKLDDYILKTLNASESKTEIIFSKEVNQEDKFVFETLLGNYDIVKIDGKIAQIHLKAGYEALTLTRLPRLLSEYRRALEIKELKFQLSEEADTNTDNLEYQLTTKGSEIGRLKIKIDTNKNIISVNSVFK